MLRKSVWITALLLALTFVFFGCDDSKFAPLDILDWKLSTVLAGIGDKNNAADSDFGGAIVLAGGPAVNIVNGALDITTAADWGQGIDLPYSVYGFKAGDKITITGKNGATPTTGAATGADSAQSFIGATTKPGADWTKKASSGTTTNGTVAANADFKIEFTLTAAEIGEITAANPKGIRIGAKPSGINFIITEITMTR
jgi:hypothetical protein